MSNVSEAINRFEGEFNCAQSILLTYGLQYGLDEETARRITAVFGGGIAGTGGICGAVSGALMAISLKCCSESAGLSEGKQKAYEKTRQFMDEFNRKHNSILCRELIGYDIGTPEGREKAVELQLFANRCPSFVQSAAEIFEKVMGDRI